jgi:hypothetical protein
MSSEQLPPSNEQPPEQLLLFDPATNAISGLKRVVYELPLYPRATPETYGVPEHDPFIDDLRETNG